MAGEEKLGGEEELLRAMLETHWDKAQGRISPSLFEGADISVSRLSILNDRELFPIFFRDLDKPGRLVAGAGQISVAAIIDAGQSHADKPTELWVTPKPETEIGKENPAHAEIMPKISRGLARKLVAALRHPPLDASNYRVPAADATEGNEAEKA
ncbi:hypothetical protein [Paraburkholderia caribensis]|uniref:hypothetical protein n=1 Tax=Paraburkholderia caribensis TaxID=75105 RepID=UPI001CAF46D7|nr:hypothetical protein [Paraburkholderia caribensis]CAG9244881.1 hypothetical protein PCAR4_150207 [Paraburkholderia caribensis]